MSLGLYTSSLTTMSKLNVALVQEKNWELKHLNNVEAVRRQGNAYSLNTEGALIALSMTEKDIDGLTLGEECQDLEHLYLAYNGKLTQIEFETDLTKLEHLYLNNCGLNSILRLPAGFANLKQLYLKGNKLRELIFEGDCPKLELLDAGENGLNTLSMPNGFLNLKYVYLQGNQIAYLPDSFVGMRHLEMLFLADNPLSNIPQDIIGSGHQHNSAKDLLAYLSSIQGKKTQYLHEAKMILVGNPMVGKSSIRIKLKDSKANLPRKEERTPALDVEPYILKNLPPELTQLDQAIDFQLNIWDFGGQGRYREIQQLFCSRKSLYVYVTAYDDEPAKEDYIGLDYWLSMVNAYSFDQEEKAASPVIYVLNKIDVEDSGIDEILSKQKYQNFVKFAKISCEEYRGFDQLIAYFRETLPLVSRDIFNNRYSLDWFRVKERLESSTENHIRYRDFIGICREEGLDVEQAQTWLTVLDRIGTVIYTGNFQDEQEWIILNCTWVKDAICKVIDSPLMQRDGVLRQAYFKTIWSDYTDPADWDSLVKLMLHEKYKLAYVLPVDEGETEYMVPSALFQKPKPALNKYPHLQKPANYAFQFRFDPFIPAGIVNKLMVTLNQHIYNDLIWGNGCILHEGATNTFVLLQEDWEKRCVQAEFIGEDAQAFYGTLVSTLQKIKDDLKSSKLLNHLDFTEWMLYDGQYLEKALLSKFGHFPWKEEGFDAMRFTGKNEPSKKKLFFSYSKEDLVYLQQLKAHLASLRHTEKIVEWDDSKIRPGEEWDEAIKQNLAEADIILLLVSADFLNTQYIWDVEIKAAMARHERKEAIVIPIFIRPCVWDGMPFGKINGLPSKATPVKSYPDQDTAWTEVAKGIASVL